MLEGRNLSPTPWALSHSGPEFPWTFIVCTPWLGDVNFGPGQHTFRKRLGPQVESKSWRAVTSGTVYLCNSFSYRLPCPYEPRGTSGKEGKQVWWGVHLYADVSCGLRKSSICMPLKVSKRNATGGSNLHYRCGLRVEETVPGERSKWRTTIVLVTRKKHNDL